VVVSESQLALAVASDRAAGRRVAIVSGCFDLLRVDDVRSLQSAAARTDRLAVLIHDDESARALNGPGRPIVKAQDRAELVAGLRGVDYVTLCSATGVERLLAL
jgi:bifunctional ADP-heptose synthase (sugar kinase/adenylyltransferase)